MPDLDELFGVTHRKQMINATEAKAEYAGLNASF
jgi:hypothetical protein